MAKIFGFDLGVASIGWAAIEMTDVAIEHDGFTGSKILGAGARCFATATNAEDRRMARGMRRRLRHRAQRMREIRTLLRVACLIDVPEPKKNGHNNFYLDRDTDINIWRLRAVDAFERKLTPRETGRILYHLAKHRGYDDITYPIKTRQNQIANAAGKDAKEELKATNSICENFAKLQSAGDTKTMCQVIYATNPSTMRNGSGADGQSIYTNSIPRSEILREAQQILTAQIAFGNDFSDVFNAWRPIAFRQRKFNESDSPMYRSVDTMRGRCNFLNRPVAPKDAPSSQLFIALSVCLQNGFSAEQISVVVDKMHQQKELKYAAVRKALEKAGVPYNGPFRTLKYARTYDSERKEYTEPDVKKIEGICFCKFNSYHALLPFTDDVRVMDRVYEILATKKTPQAIKLAVSEILPEHAEAISGMSSSKFINLSLDALYKLIPHMHAGKTYNQACDLNGWDHRNTGKAFVDMTDKVAHGFLRKLDYSVLGRRLTSPVARRTLAQLRRVYNAMVRKYGVPDKIHLEIGRELKKSPRELAILEAENKRNRNINRAAREEYGKNFNKYKLYMEQNCQCAYCGKTMIAGNWDAYEIDHILPYSRSLDNSQSNKVLVCRACNQSKGSKTPYEYLSSEDFYNMSVRARGYHNAAKFAKLTNTTLPLNFDESHEFIARNANDNATIAKFAKQYMSDGINTANKIPVLVRAGALTDYLRHQWGLEKNREESDKHHAQDAIVIACATQYMVSYLSTLSSKFENKYKLISENGEAWYKSLKTAIQSPWPDFRNDVQNVLDGITVSRPPRCNATGSVHDQTIYANPRSYRTKRGKNKTGVKGTMKVRFGGAVRGDMFRFDIWRTNSGKYTCVPIFVGDTVSCDETKFLVPDAEFICTLHKDDYVKIKTRANEEFQGYITQMDHGTNFILYRQDNKNIPVVKKSVGMCADIKKCVITVLGETKYVKLPEVRTPVVNKK